MPGPASLTVARWIASKERRTAGGSARGRRGGTRVARLLPRVGGRSARGTRPLQDLLATAPAGTYCPLLWPVDQFGECRCGDVKQVAVFGRAETRAVANESFGRPMLGIHNHDLSNTNMEIEFILEAALVTGRHDLHHDLG